MPQGFGINEANNYPLITIIIPTYNRSNWLERAVKNAHIHKYPNFEVIISNNASIDDTKDVLLNLKLKFPKIKIINHQYLLPINLHWDSVVRNYSNGEYIMILPDDDIIINPNYLLNAIKLFQKYQSIGIVFGNYENIDTKNNILSIINAKFGEFIDRKFMYENFNKSLFGINGIGIPHLTAIFKKESYLKVKGFDLQCLSPDTHLWLKIILFYDLGFVNEIVAQYMLHPNNITKTANLKLYYTDTKIADNIKSWLDKSDIPIEITKTTLSRLELKFGYIYKSMVIKKIKNNFSSAILSIKYFTFFKFLLYSKLRK